MCTKSSTVETECNCKNIKSTHGKDSDVCMYVYIRIDRFCYVGLTFTLHIAFYSFQSNARYIIYGIVLRKNWISVKIDLATHPYFLTVFLACLVD